MLPYQVDLVYQAEVVTHFYKLLAVLALRGALQRPVKRVVAMQSYRAARPRV
jgi:hypothetical protein